MSKHRSWLRYDLRRKRRVIKRRILWLVPLRWTRELMKRYLIIHRIHRLLMRSRMNPVDLTLTYIHSSTSSLHR